MREELLKILSKLHPSDAIALIESIGKELRRKNSIRIANQIPVETIEMDRPDLIKMKP